MNFDALCQYLATLAKHLKDHLAVLKRLQQSETKPYEALQDLVQNLQKDKLKSKSIIQKLKHEFTQLPEQDTLSKGFKTALLASLSRLEPKPVPSPKNPKKDKAQTLKKSSIAKAYSVIGNAKDEWETELNNLVKNPIFAYMDLNTAIEKAGANAVVVIKLHDNTKLDMNQDKNVPIEINGVKFEDLQTIILGKHTYTIQENEITRSN